MGDMDMETKSFSLRAVLTISTGRRLTEEVADVYAILNWITSDEIYTHQIPRAMRSAQPWLLKCFPELAPANAAMDSLDRWIQSDQTDGHEGIKMWLAELQMMFPELKDAYEVAPMPEGWVSIDPVIELRSMVEDPKKVIMV